MLTKPSSDMLNTFLLLSVASSFCSAYAYYVVYGGLNKGLDEAGFPMRGLLSTAGFLALSTGALSGIFVLFVQILANGGGNGMSASGVKSTVGFGAALLVLLIILGIAYAVAQLVVGIKLASNFEGKVKTLGLLILSTFALAAIALLAGGASVGSDSVGTVTVAISVVQAGIAVMFFKTATEVIDDKSLF